MYMRSAKGEKIFRLIESDEKLRLYEHKGYQIAVIGSGQNKTIRVSLAPSDHMDSIPVLTLCGDHFLIDPPIVNDKQIDELIRGIENARDFISDFHANKTYL